MKKDGGRALDRAGLPVIATAARLLCRELTLQNEYLRLENRALKKTVPGRTRESAIAYQTRKPMARDWWSMPAANLTRDSLSCASSSLRLRSGQA
jgi:hypothetical protein